MCISGYYGRNTRFCMDRLRGWIMVFFLGYFVFCFKFMGVERIGRF